MPEVSVQIANRDYELACGDGEEERVQELAAYVDEKITELRRQLPGTPEVKLLVFAALIGWAFLGERVGAALVVLIAAGAVVMEFGGG